jgi:hypothetical protein
VADVSARDEILAAVAKHKAANVANQVGMGGKLTTEIDVEYGGQTYKFAIKRPNMGDYMKMGVLKTKLLMQGSLEPVPLEMIDPSVKQIATVVSTLDVVVFGAKVVIKTETEISESPFTLIPEESDDYEFLEAIYMKYVAWVNSFRRAGAKPAGGSGEPSTGAETVGNS